MYVATCQEMRQLDKLAIERFGLPGLVLMENAAHSVARAVFDFWSEWPAQPTVAILAGPGQNGGDGWALARLFLSKGFQVFCYLVKNKDQVVKGDAGINLNVVRNLGLAVEVLDGDDYEPENRLPWEKFDLVVDALFGNGLDRPVSGPAAVVLREAVMAKIALQDRMRVVAVDLPSGLSGDTGESLGPPLAADLTVTFGAPKLGLYLKEGPFLAGKVVVGDIGLVPQMMNLHPPKGRLSEPDELRLYLPKRSLSSHKGIYGHVMVAGGAQGRTGALSLAAMGASRSGAALVTALHPASLGPVLEIKLTEAMTEGLPEDEPGQLSKIAGEVILELCRDKSVLAMGPGLGLGHGAFQAVWTVLEQNFLPLVLDADALTHVAGRLGELKFLTKGLVLTPHPGEAARLLGVSTENIQDDRIGSARKIAELSGAVVVLKGYNTIIFAPDGHFFINTTGGPHMAVGGSGDLLTGLVAGLIAQGLSTFQAAVLAVWVHGRAADLTLNDLGPFALTPTEFVERLPRVWAELTNR